MMAGSNPYDKAHELARAITDSEAYRRYAAAWTEISQNPEAKERVRQFRAMQMEVNQARILGQSLPDEKIRQVTLEYARLNREKDIAEFLNAEGMFIQMFTDIQQIIQKSVESALQD